MTADNAMSNKKAELLANVVEHVDITQYDARPVIDAMRKMSFSSRDTARAADILSMAIEDKACSVWLTLAGSTSAAGCMHVYRDMIRYGMVDAVVSTGASIVDMDFFEALGFKHYQGSQFVNDTDLRDPVQLDPDADGPERQAVGVVHGAVERVDHPPHTRRARYVCAFLAEQPVVGPRRPDAADDECLARPVHRRDDVGG